MAITRLPAGTTPKIRNATQEGSPLHRDLGNLLVARVREVRQAEIGADLTGAAGE